ncbi:hypothetical protein GCM10007423_13490 [Dyadobacter endophyticus]|uniref:Spi protease inhibitor domain-containing protein n=1 Tax=Dyadobacter endophyticus TaxID=1749036 RepID=A0ABQ1YKL3_9BACT|nr:Spi family protease inhibitor [Dyadobacter endophyticus]GGH27581.1 hypothetical protein GCM10007423_13490 [Dyadobacter endophyticus]
MKSITNKLLLSVIAACSLLQCRQETGSSPPGPEAYPYALLVTAVEAEKLAFGELTSSTNNAARTAATDVSKRIKNVRTLNDDEGNPLMHIIHFEADVQPDAGFVIIAGDKRVVPVLAKGDSGKFEPDGENPGPRIWIEHVKAEVATGKRHVTTPVKAVELLLLAPSPITISP